MLLRKKPKERVLCYVLVFDQIEIIEKSLRFLTKFSDWLEIVIIENPSANTNHIKNLVENYGKKGYISRYYLFSENITGNAYDTIVNLELTKISKRKYVILTDGDLISKDNSWLTEELSILEKNSDVFACGISLDMKNLPILAFPESTNWIPPDMRSNKYYYEAYTGGHLLILRGGEFADFIKWKNLNNLSLVDSEMHRYCYDVIGKKWARTKKSKALHLTWDLYSDPNHPYTKMRTEKSHKETWYHKKSADFEFKDYS